MHTIIHIHKIKIFMTTETYEFVKHSKTRRARRALLLVDIQTKQNNPTRKYCNNHIRAAHMCVYVETIY